MTKVLLIADGHCNISPVEILFAEQLNLVQEYSVVVARQFMGCVNV